jgi:hypothetical protein
MVWLGRARTRHLHLRSAGPGLLQQRHPMLTMHAICSTKCPQEIQIQIFEIFKLGWSLYWIGILKQFLLGQEVVFCFRAILNLGLSYVSDSIFGRCLS